MSPHLRFKQVLNWNSSIPPSNEAHVHSWFKENSVHLKIFPTVLAAPGLSQV